MKKLLFSKKVTLVLLVILLLSSAFYAYMIARPISYGMDYHHQSVYEGFNFEGTMTFRPDNKVINFNSNYNEPQEQFYYYKNGYLFGVWAQNEEELEEEIAYIDANFEEALKKPFYASKINAFRMVSEGIDGYTVVYTCKPAISFAIGGGVIEVVLVALTVASWLLSKKQNKENACENG